MTILSQEYAEFLYREAWYLDNRRWDDWLSIYAEDATYWAPAMVGDEEWTDDPDNDVSLMYMDRAGLEARIFRIEGTDSYATDPLPHTTHLVTNVLTQGERDDLIIVSAAWMVRSYSRVRGSISRGGLYEFALRKSSGGLKIVRKKIFIHDDRIVGPIDIYNI
ncbi:MAG: 2-halobenzoate 1,2-dioxygenase small subunit [Alphaproteobacteria bacterium MarineAlpha11_Bin1]|nr:MAG: 2-halobenzoate 1,2-dioxygenase small subunit [Alphaproteobacteria bacterium MarineAlpha11_Bin1]|tara:strand:+ start:27301 stop:27789 length:489 start_codon:yes stop_codon:yes gene_type:complete